MEEQQQQQQHQSDSNVIVENEKKTSNEEKDDGHNSCDDTLPENLSATERSSKPSAPYALELSKPLAKPDKNSSIDQQATNIRIEPVTFGDQVDFDKLDQQYVYRQYLLPHQDSATLREFFSNKQKYSDAANAAEAQLELTQLVARPRDSEQPNYQVIEIRAVTKASLDSFYRQLLSMNPSLKTEAIAFDPSRYVSQAIARRFSVYSSLSDPTCISSLDAEMERAEK